MTRRTLPKGMKALVREPSKADNYAARPRRLLIDFPMESMEFGRTDLSVQPLCFDELLARDTWPEVMTVGLTGTEELAMGIRGPTWRAFPCRDVLAVSTIVPG